MPEFPHDRDELRISVEPNPALWLFIRQSRNLFKGDLQVNSIRVGRRFMQALKLFVTSSQFTVLREKAQKNKIKWFIGCFMTATLWSLPALAQGKNEVGLVIGGIVTPSQALSPGANPIGPGGTVLPNRDITLDSSLTLGAEYDREFVRRQKFAIDGGIDFLASPP